MEKVLRIIIQKLDLKVVKLETQADMKRLAGARSICLDVLGEDDIGRLMHDFMYSNPDDMFDSDMANRKSKEIALALILKKLSLIEYPVVFQGGLNYSAMKLPYKLAMKAFAVAVAKTKNPTETEKSMAKMINHSYDISDEKYITQIVEYIK